MTPLDESALAQRIEKIAQTTFQMPGRTDPADWTGIGNLLSARVSDYPANQIQVHSQFVFRDDSSAHECLQNEQFRKTVEAEMRVIQAQLSAAMPGLVKPYLSFGLDLVGQDRNANGLFRFSIGPYSNIGNVAMTAVNVSRQMGRAAKILAPVEASTARRFNIRGRDAIFAACPEDALRIHLALTDPELFDHWPDCVPDYDIVETLSAKRVLKSLFEGQAHGI